jgi:hypothetical protein
MKQNKDMKMFKNISLIISCSALVFASAGFAQSAEVKCPDAKDLTYTSMGPGNYKVTGKTTGSKQVELEGKYPAIPHITEGYKPIAKQAKLFEYTMEEVNKLKGKLICVYTKDNRSTVGALTLVSKDTYSQCQVSKSMTDSFDCE